MDSAFRAQLPPALRAAVEASPIDLEPWIDPDRELPPRPIDVALEKYAAGHRDPKHRRRCRSLLRAGDVFDLDDITLPRIQYGVWVRVVLEGRPTQYVYRALTGLRAFLQACGVRALDGVNLTAWAAGELPEIARAHSRAWYWLHRYESGEPYHHNLPMIFNEWNESVGLREKICPAHSERVAQRGTVKQQIRRARAIRENPPGVKLEPVFPKRQTAGSREANCELFAFWKIKGMNATKMRRRWNALPRRVRGELSGDDEYYLADIAPGKRGCWVMSRRAKRVAVGAHNQQCDGGANCPRILEWRRRHESGWRWKRVWEWWRGLPTDHRKRYCGQHHGVPKSGGALAAAVTRSGSGERRRGCGWRDRLFYRLHRAGWSAQKIAQRYNQLPLRRRRRIRPDDPCEVTVNAVKRAIDRAQSELDPAKALERFRQRASRRFDLWCERKKNESAGVHGDPSNPFRRNGWSRNAAEEYLGMSEAERQSQFGDFRPTIEASPNRWTDSSQRITQGAARMGRERKLAALAEAAAAENPPAAPVAPGREAPAETAAPGPPAGAGEPGARGMADPVATGTPPPNGTAAGQASAGAPRNGRRCAR